MSHDAPQIATPSWGAIVLACKDCGKRSSGPKRLKAKAVVGELKQSLRHVKPRPRVVLTSCLGLCPKRAMVVAGMGGVLGMRVVTIDSLSQLAEAVPMLVDGAALSPR